MNLRQWLRAASAVLGATGSNNGATPYCTVASAPWGGRPNGSQARTPLALRDFQPRSMLHVTETKVERARFPVIDIHAHLSFAAHSRNGVALGEEMKYLAAPGELLPVMDRKNLRTLVDLTGGVGTGLQETIRRYQTSHP